MSKPSKPSKFTMKERQENIELVLQYHPNAVVTELEPGRIQFGHPSLQTNDSSFAGLNPDAFVRKK